MQAPSHEELFDPATLNVPAAQATGVAEVAMSAQKCPGVAVHAPAHWFDVVSIALP